MILNIENVGVFRGKHSFNLEKGLNEVRAPNAKGKTSFTRSLELFLTPRSELKDKGYYMNLFATAPDEQLKIELKFDDIIWNRRFRRPQKRKDLLLVDDNAIPLKGINLSNICFAIPKNDLMNSILYGKPIQDYIETVSGSISYAAIIKSLEIRERNYRRQYQIYKDSLIRLEETRRILHKDGIEKEEYETKLDKFPDIDEDKLLKDKETRDQYLEKEKEKEIMDNKIREKKGQIESLEQHIRDLKVDIKRQVEIINEIEEEHPLITNHIEKVKDLLDDQDKLQRQIKQELSKVNDELKSISDNWVKRKKYGEEKCYACGKLLTLKELQDFEKSMESAKLDYNRQLKKVKREIEDQKDEINQLQIQERELSIQKKNLDKNEKSLARRELELNKITNELKDDLNKQKKLEKEIDKLLENVSDEILELKKQREKIKDRVKILESKIAETKKRIKELENATKGAEILTNKIEFLEESISFLYKRKEEITEKAKNNFNHKINEIYNKLEFADFKNIEIKDDYKIYISREKEGITMDDWPLEALATSELYTLGITFLIAAKEEYLPDFPFFVIDEIITSYDEDRMQKIKEYIRDITDYVIVTQLQPESTLEELTIAYIS